MNKSKLFLSSLLLGAVLFTGCDDKEKIDEKVISIDRDKSSEFVSQSFKLVTHDGKNIQFKSTQQGFDFSEFKGKKAVLIDVFATWCQPCIEEIPVLKELKEKYKDDLEIVSVLFEKEKTPEEIAEFIKEHGINYPITIGDENFALAQALGDIQKVPEMFLFSKDGEFVEKFVGKTTLEEFEENIKIAIAKEE